MKHLFLFSMALFFSCQIVNPLPFKAISKNIQSLLNNSVNDKNIGILFHVQNSKYGFSWTGASGLDDVKKQSNLEKNQCFRIASVTKTFVACSILRLWEDGRLRLDDPISKYIAKSHYDILERGSYDPDNITIRHLITHSSGLFDHTRAKEYFERIEKDPSHVWTRTEQLEALVNWGKPVGAIGEKFSYSDTGYILLAEILEKIRGESMQFALLGLLKWNKLGLKNTIVEDALDNRKNPKNRIHQYIQGTDTYGWNPSIDLYGGGGLLSTTKDLALFFDGLFQHKIFKNKATLDTMLAKTTYSLVDKSGMDYRKGIYLVKLNGLDAWTHSGYWGTQVVYIPAKNLTMAANYSNGWQVRGQAPVFEKVLALLEKR